MSTRALRTRPLAAAFAAAAIAFVSGSASAADDVASYPSRPIRLVVTQAAGTGDIVPRLLAAKLAASLGQPVVVENRPGASTNIANEIVARSAPDGYTLLHSSSVMTLLPTLVGPSVVDPATELVPIAKIIATHVLVAVNASLGVRTLDELVALARERPGRVPYATLGVAQLPHFVALAISRRAGIELLHVPFNNLGQAQNSFVSGEVPVFFTFWSQVGHLVADGKVRVLAVASTRRTSALPEVPTVVELGYPDAVVEPWTGLFAPAGTSPAIVERLNREIATILALPDVRERLAGLGLDPLASTPQGFAAVIRAQVAAWPAIVKAAGVPAAK